MGSSLTRTQWQTNWSCMLPVSASAPGGDFGAALLANWRVWDQASSARRFEESPINKYVALPNADGLTVSVQPLALQGLD